MPFDKYTAQQRVIIVTEYIASGQRPSVVKENFRVRFQGAAVPSSNTIRKAYADFNYNGCLNKEHRKIEYPSRQISEEKNVQVCASVQVNKQQALKDISNQVDLSRSSVYKILHEEKYHPYKLQAHQEILERDVFNRMAFSEITTELINRGLIDLVYVCFSDEATIVLKERPNRQNLREWSRFNHHPVIDCNSQYQAKVNVWAGMFQN